MPIPDQQSARRITRSVHFTERLGRTQPRRGKRPRGYPPGAALGFIRCAARAKGAFDTSASTITVDHVTVEVGTSPLEDSEDLTEELTVVNRYSYEGEDNDDLTIAWRQDREEWYLLQKACPDEEE